jgi:epsilon-lactone hydrolase
MQAPTLQRRMADSVTTHRLDPEDANVAATFRGMVSTGKGAKRGVEARGQFDALMEGVSPREDVTYEADTLRGISGVWVRPTDWRLDEVILHLHGGWFNFGSAMAYRHLVGHIAARSGTRAFIPDYRRAPEHPFPAATDDVLTSYRGLADQGFSRIALTGDSAGGNLALAAASQIIGNKDVLSATLLGVAVLSPVTDLTLSGASYATRAEADPLFTRLQVADLVGAYLDHADPKHPLASPLFGRHAGLPPIRIHVGDDEVLLDDSLRYVDRAVAAGVDAHVDVWMGMPHGFQASIGKFKAATQSFDAIGQFLAGRFQASTNPPSA